MQTRQEVIQLEMRSLNHVRNQILLSKFVHLQTFRRRTNSIMGHPGEKSQDHRLIKSTGIIVVNALCSYIASIKQIDNVGTIQIVSFRMETVEDDSGFKSEDYVVKGMEFGDNEDTEESIEDISFNEM